MPWLLLLLAGFFEILWVLGLKYSQGFSRPLPTLITVAAMLLSILLLGIAVKSLPVGTAYAVWTGIGVVGTALLGILLFGDSVSAARLACLAVITLGIVGLKMLPAS